MTIQSRATSLAFQADAVDAFLAYARIYFASTERLTEIFLMTSRGAFDDCAAATNASATSAGPTASAAHVALRQAMVDRTLTFSRDVYETMTRTHLEAAKLFADRIAVHGVHLPSSAFAFHDHWNDAFSMFVRGITDLSETTGSLMAQPTVAAQRKAA